MRYGRFDYSREQSPKHIFVPIFVFFFSSRRRHTRFKCDWSSDVCSSDLFAGHYGFDIDVLAAYRPTGKGRVERQVDIVRDHVLAGRAFMSLEEMDAAFAGWAPIRRTQVHRTHGEVIGVRAAVDHAALRPLPATRYLVAEQHLRRGRKGCALAV